MPACPFSVRTLAILCVLLPVLAAPAHAGPSTAEQRLAELEKRLEHSLQLIETLQGRVRQLEAQKAHRESAPAAPERPDDRSRIVEPQPDPIAPPAVWKPTPTTLPLRGFADIGASFGSKGRPRGFTVGSLDLYLTPQFGDHVKGLVELLFEVVEGGELLTDLERLQLGYTFSDALTLWGGRFHTPYGFWNTGFHHGENLQVSLKRPRFIDFEDKGGVLPSHVVGLWATGSVPANSNDRVGYDLVLANAPTLHLDGGLTGALHPNSAGHTQPRALLGANLNYRFGGSLQGLQLGGHALRGDVRDDGALPTTTRLQMAGLWWLYEGADWEIIGETYHFRNRDLSGGSGRHASHAGFLQAARTIGPWTPYARIERAVLNQNDAFFARQEHGRSYSRQAVGLRYDLNPSTSLKLELNHTRQADGEPPGYNEAHLQYAIRF